MSKIFRQESSEAN